MLHKIFQFQYMQQGQLKQLNIPTAHRLTPIRPLVDALGLRVNTAMDYAKRFPYEMLITASSRGRQTLCLKPEHIAQWLHCIKRCQDEHTLHHFQQHYVRALESFLEDACREIGDRVQMPSLFDEHYLTEDEARAKLAERYPIYLDDKPLDATQRLRLLLNQLGETDYTIVKFMAEVSEALVLHRLPREGVETELGYEFWGIPAQNIPANILDIMKRGQWYVATVFFRKYPELYVPLTREVYTTVDFKSDGQAIGGIRIMAWGGFPWFRPEHPYYTAIRDRQRSFADTRYTLDKEAEDKLLADLRAEHQARMIAAKAQQERDKNERNTLTLPAPSATQSPFQFQTELCPA